MLRRLMIHLAIKAASDPRVQAKLREEFNKNIRPQAESAWRKAQPRIDEAREKIDEAREKIDEAAKVANPRTDPGRFVGEIIKRWHRH
tara:strand:- start:1424 stop:1687 length:264 start_codon:yes stop_codon:yes gene_type:complete